MPRRIKNGQQRSVADRKNFIFFHCPLDGVRFTALLAFGIQLPIDYGYGGAIYLKAKTTQLREHYMRNYGAIPFSRFDPFLLLIDGDAARELFGQYLKEV